MLLRILCPVNKFRLVLGSEYLDNVSSFTRFLMWGINKGYGPATIAEEIEIRRDLIDGEITYLENIGYIKNNDGRYIFTDAGANFLRLVKIISEFNSNKHLAQVNMFTGKFSAVSDNFLNDGDNYGLQQIRKTIIPGLLKNLNYGGSREYVFQEFGNWFEDLTDEQKESLYVKLELESRGFIPFELSRYPAWTGEASGREMHFSLLLKRPFYEYVTGFQNDLVKDVYNLYLVKPSMTKLEFVLRVSRILPGIRTDIRLRIANIIWAFFKRNIGVPVYYDGCASRFEQYLPSGSYDKEGKYRKVTIECEAGQIFPQPRKIVVDVDGQKYFAVVGYKYVGQKDVLQQVDFDQFGEVALNGSNSN